MCEFLNPVIRIPQ